jgi:hypothetical protein
LTDMDAYGQNARIEEHANLPHSRPSVNNLPRRVAQPQTAHLETPQLGLTPKRGMGLGMDTLFP